jgi:energy-coupling factor transporter ATP-binding protein EcfA2
MPTASNIPGIPVLKMEGISKSFSGVPALDQVRLEVARGEVHAVMGENGAGKSTLMKILSGLVLKDHGHIYLDAAPVEINTPKAAQNIDPNYKKHYFRKPVLCPHSDEHHVEKWVVYANDYIAAKELTLHPGQTVKVKDGAAYGCIIIQGHGKFGVYDAEASVMLRFGQASNDEYFVSEAAAKEGVVISNHSQFQPMVILKHFGPNHPNMPKKA